MKELEEAEQQWVSGGRPNQQDLEKKGPSHEGGGGLAVGAGVGERGKGALG